MLGPLSWIVAGIIAGWLAGLVTKGWGFGLVGNMIIGLVGALVGGWLAGILFNVHNAVSGLNLSTIVVAFFGALIVVYIARLVKA